MADPRSTRSDPGGPDPGRFGLCATCRYQRVVGNTRGSVFSLCERSKTDARFAKYPRLPVLECVGYTRSEGAADG